MGIRRIFVMMFAARLPQDEHKIALEELEQRLGTSIHHVRNDRLFALFVLV